MSVVPPEPELLVDVQPEAAARSKLRRYLDWLAETRDLHFDTFAELHDWSTDRLEEFWGSLWDYFQIKAYSPPDCVLEERRMPGARWFPGATLNYAEHALGRPEDADRVAVRGYSQTRPEQELTFAELADQVRRVRAGLRRLGVGKGDRVAAYLPNIPETVVAYLATASLGAIWSSCAPEFGARSVIDRFGQIEPKVLLTVAGYTYGDKPIDKRDAVAEIRAGLPGVETVVQVPYGDLRLDDVLPWEQLAAETDEPLTFEPVPFDHPMAVLFSSGTTGLPKAIMQCHGGLLMEQLKLEVFHWDLGPEDRLLWFSTTAWMLWNALVGGLLTRASIVTVDGNPLYPDLGAQWRLAAEAGATVMGANPTYLMACRRAGLHPRELADLSNVTQVNVGGAPLPAEGARWVLDEFGPGVLLNLGSGATDLCTGITHTSPMQPVYAGEMSGAALGVDVQAYDEDGQPVVGEVGELVITTPMPSMPVGFWGDESGERLRAAYFSMYDGVFRLGDWCRVSSVGSVIITGRSDATLNRGGVRLGTAEFYRVLQDVPEITDCVVVHLEDPSGSEEGDGRGELICFVVPAEGVTVDEDLEARLRRVIAGSLSPRHVPDKIVGVPAVPYGRTGKKLEVPVKKILRGADPDTVASPGALMDPAALDAYVAYARERSSRR